VLQLPRNLRLLCGKLLLLGVYCSLKMFHCLRLVYLQ
jgi:hypothetical protein